MSVNKKSALPREKAAAARETARKVGLRLHGSAREGVIIVLLAACMFLLLALYSFTQGDPGWTYSGPETEVANWMGPVGAWISDVLYSLFGVSALWWPGMFGFAAWWLIRSRQVRFDWDTISFAVRCGGMVLLLLGTTTLGALYFDGPDPSIHESAGGILGLGLVGALKPAFYTGGTGLLAIAGILCGIPLLTGLSWLNVMDELGHRFLQLIRWVGRRGASHAAEGDEVTVSPISADKAPEPAADNAETPADEPRSRWWHRLAPGMGSRAEVAAVAPGPHSEPRSEPVTGIEGRSDIPWYSPETTPSAQQLGTARGVPLSRRSAETPSTGSTEKSIEPPSTEGQGRSTEAPSREWLKESREPTLGNAFASTAGSDRTARLSETDTGPVTMSLRAERDEPDYLASRHGSTAADAASGAQAGESDVPPAPPVTTPDALQSTAPQSTAPQNTASQALGKAPEAPEPEPGTSDASADDSGARSGHGDPGRLAVDESREGLAGKTPGKECRAEERRAEEIPEPVLPDDGGALAAVAGPAVQTEIPPSLPSAPLSHASQAQASQAQASQVQASRTPSNQGQVATAEQGRAAADSGPTVWTVEHLQSQRPVLEDMPEPDGELPSLRLLTPPEPHQPNYTEQQLADMAELLEMRLREYGVKAEVVDTWPGPVITRFEIKPAAGVKVSKISNLAKDLARSLMVKSVRVVEVIPGRPTVGIEIPNPSRAMIRLREVIDSDRYQQESSGLTMALGQDIGGAPVVANLGKMPHVLVAGTTGSGKSVGVNAMLISMLLKATPAELRLIMVDPKMLELSVYDGIPHLLAPVVTDMKEAANSLRWCVAEMERRYKLMAAMGVRNIAGFNSKLDEAGRAGAQVADPLWEPQPWEMHQTPPILEKLPYIVVVIDEFADMFMIVGKKVEELIARLAQKARAAGIHLVLATQRPSVDVVTGLIKANIPTRMAFQVSSRIDSRTILDQGGAENLLGHGDMLYLPAGSGQPTRVHGAFVDDDEVHRVVDDWKRRGEPEYIDEILSGGVSADALTGLEAEGSGDDGDAEQDALYDEAVAFVTETRRASISAVQRRFKIGYNRAARLVESMEAAGVVSAMGSNGGREVLAPPPVGG